MHFTILAASLACLASAAPHLNKRQTDDTTGGNYTIPAPIVVDAETAAAAAELNAQLAKEARAQVTNVDRYKYLLSKNFESEELAGKAELQSRAVFDFNKAAEAGEGGRSISVTEKSFPMLVGNNMATTVVFLSACGMNSPHIHPRASEFITLVQGGVTVGFTLENGFFAPDGGLASEVRLNLSPFQATVFPQGSIHYQFNDNCAPATFIATLNSNDPGTSQVAQNFLGQNRRVVQTVLGGAEQIDATSLDAFRQNLPANLVLDMEKCMTRCEIATEAASAPTPYGNA